MIRTKEEQITALLVAAADRTHMAAELLRELQCELSPEPAEPQSVLVTRSALTKRGNATVRLDVGNTLSSQVVDGAAADLLCQQLRELDRMGAISLIHNNDRSTR